MNLLTSQELYEILTSIDWANNHGHISFNLGGLDVILNTTDPVGIAIQSWLGEFMRNKNIYFREQQNSQEFPDYFLGECNDKNLLEVKSFNYDRVPAFDIANFDSYCDSLRNNPYKLDADYIIFGYTMSENGEVCIKDIWLKKVWEIAGNSQKYPLKVQEKRGVIYNIRPNSQFKHDKPVVFSNKFQFIEAIYYTLVLYKDKTFADIWLSDFRSSYREYYGVDLF